MKKIYQLFIFLSVMSYGQKGRVGINTENPEATLDIQGKPVSEMPTGYAQGVSFPNFTTAERSKFKNVKKGTMIYNTTSSSLEIYTVVNNVEGWYSMQLTKSEDIATKVLSKDEVVKTQKLMFQDNEEESILFNKNERGFYLAEMLQISKVASNKFKIRNFLPHTFKNAEVYLFNSEITGGVKVAEIEEIAPLAEIEVETSFTGSSVLLEDENGGVDAYTSSSLNKVNNAYSIKVPNDALFEKMQTVKHETFISFQKYGNGNWGIMTAKYARLYLPIIANMAYTYSTEAFKEKFLNYPHELYDNSNKAINRPAIYEKFFEVAEQNFGVVSKVEGLGGGSYFGVNSRMLNNDAYYAQGNKWPLECWSHEYGHVLGYSHASNMTYRSSNNKGHGYVDVIIELYGELLKKGELPFIKNPYK